MTAFHTLRWTANTLELLDQRWLPDRCEYLRCDSARAVAQAIRDLVVRGAPAIGCAAAYGVALEALQLSSASKQQFTAGMDNAFSVLALSRPTAVNLAWALQRMRASVAQSAGMDGRQRAATLLALAKQIADEDLEINRRLGAFGAALLPQAACVMTHCNAGALATAGHGTALGVIRSAIETDKVVEVIANETRPFLQGARLTAWELQQDGIPVTLIADSAAGYLMGRRRIDAVIVGADRVAANGDVANKIGTYMMAVLARRHNIPFYVACPLSTLDIAVDSGTDIPIEERDTAEVAGYRDMRWAPAGIRIANPVFDITPAELVSALITEKGVVHTPGRAALETLLAG
ncbi:MAG: S-methyl-5-thioribose-1-phosphate isomerase [Burkholderiales bacterium]|nr:S-methyl-5-thioribose-1-phosphate isomerase [Burkholderiales bacterium]